MIPCYLLLLLPGDVLGLVGTGDSTPVELDGFVCGTIGITGSVVGRVSIAGTVGGRAKLRTC